jgi:hypothetical protein
MPVQASSSLPITLSGNQSAIVLIVALTVSLFQTAAQGDIVVFTFFPKNHTVTQSSFAQPCTPLDGGFDTGLYVFYRCTACPFIDGSSVANPLQTQAIRPAFPRSK